MATLTVGAREAGPETSQQDLESIIASFSRRGLGGQPQLRQALLRAQGPSLRRELSGLRGEIEGEKRERIGVQQKSLAGLADQLAQLSSQEQGLQIQGSATQQDIQRFIEQEQRRLQQTQQQLQNPFVFGVNPASQFSPGGVTVATPTAGGQFTLRTINTT